MPLYEQRTYSIKVGQMPEMLRLYTEEGWPALEADGLSKNLVGYFISDTGRLHQLIHVWRFEGDTERRDFWDRLYASERFMAVAAKIRPLIDTQEVQLLRNAPWGPTP